LKFTWDLGFGLSRAAGKASRSGDLQIAEIRKRRFVNRRSLKENPK
jgi:hypothetical protein